MRDSHIIFWLNFSRVYFPFLICIFASSNNKNMCKLSNFKVCLCEMFHSAFLIVLFIPKIDRYVKIINPFFP